MGSSAALSASAVVAIFGTVLIAIAFGTNQWQVITVDRDNLRDAVRRGNTGLNWNITHDRVYYSRSYGLFRLCFVGTVEERPIGEYFTAFVNVMYFINTDHLYFVC